LVRRSLARFLQIDPLQIFLTKDSLGRPILDSERMSDFPTADAFDFSYSHGENLFALGVMQTGRIGVDLEIVRPENAIPAADCRELSSFEKDWLLALPHRKRISAFFHCWTAKEALLKALGLGVSFGMDQIEIARDSSGRYSLSKIANSRQLAADWSLEHSRIKTGETSTIIAVAWA
jgi:4'-phosphopantetheinyl transferase